MSPSLGNPSSHPRSSVLEHRSDQSSCGFGNISPRSLDRSLDRPLSILPNQINTIQSRYKKLFAAKNENAPDLCMRDNIHVLLGRFRPDIEIASGQQPKLRLPRSCNACRTSVLWLSSIGCTCQSLSCTEIFLTRTSSAVRLSAYMSQRWIM